MLIFSNLVILEFNLILLCLPGWPANFPARNWTVAFKVDELYSVSLFTPTCLHCRLLIITIITILSSGPASLCQGCVLLQHGLFLWSFVVSHAWRRGWEYFSKTHGNLLLGSQRWQCKQGGSRTVGFEAALTLQDIADEAKGLCLSHLTAKAALVHWLNISHSASLGKHLFIMIRPASSWEFFCSSLKNKKQKNTWT